MLLQDLQLFTGIELMETELVVPQLNFHMMLIAAVVAVVCSLNVDTQIQMDFRYC